MVGVAKYKGKNVDTKERSDNKKTPLYEEKEDCIYFYGTHASMPE